MEKPLSYLYKDFNITVKTKADAVCGIVLANTKNSIEISECYDSVLINELNVADKINENSPNSFFKTGGMFNKPDEEQIINIINSDTDVIIISKIKNDVQKINSLLWLGIEKNTCSNISFYDSVDENTLKLINAYMRDKKIIYPMDFIALPGHIDSGIAYPLLCQSYEVLYKHGYRYAFIEIYTLVGYYDDIGNFCNLNLRNQRSVLLNELIGAQIIGTTGTHEHKKGKYVVIAKSEIYGLDLFTAIKLMKEKASNRIIG